MFTSIFNRLFTKQSSPKTLLIRNRRLVLESLESRELLSVTPFVPPLVMDISVEQIAPPELQAADVPEDYNAHDWNLVNSQGLSAYATWGEVGGELRLTKIDATFNTFNLSASLNLSGCTALTELNCEHNTWESLDVSGCTALTIIWCRSNNTLKSLNASGCTALQNLYCGSNPLTSLDVSGCTSLKSLNFTTIRSSTLTLNLSGCTALTGLGFYEESSFENLNIIGGTALQNFYFSSELSGTLNLSGCTSLSSIYIESSSLRQLNVSGCTALYNLECSGNQLTTLDISGLTNLYYLDCNENKLTALDVSGCTGLQYLNCEGNRLTSLDVSECTDLQVLKCDNNGLVALCLPETTGFAIVGYESIDEYISNHPEVQVTIGSPDIPAAPTDIFVTEETYDSVNVSWKLSSGAISYYLYYRKSGVEEWSKVNTYLDSKTHNYRLGGLDSNTPYQFSVIASNSKGDSERSDTAEATTLPLLPSVPNITTQPSSTTYGIGDTATALSVVVDANGNLTYQWYSNTSNSNSGGTLIDGATAATYTPSTATEGTMYYYVVITNETSGETESTTSNVAEIAIVKNFSLENIARDWASEVHTINEKIKIDGILYKVEKYFHTAAGLDAFGLATSSGEALLVFRGTAGKDADIAKTLANTLMDIFDDANPAGIGYRQYQSGRDELFDWAKKVTETRKLSVIGHSLGGALAQWFAADWTSERREIGSVITYNAPGISKTFAEKFNAGYVKNIQHNISNGDIVSMAGEKFISGGNTEIRYYNATGGWNILANHMNEFGLRTDYKKITVARLNDFWFAHSDIHYWTWMAGVSFIAKDTGLFTSSLFTRGTTELFRTQAGAWIHSKFNPSFWEGVIAVTEGAKPSLPIDLTVSPKAISLLGGMSITPVISFKSNQSQWNAEVSGEFKLSSATKSLRLMGEFGSDGLWMFAVGVGNLNIPIGATAGLLLLQSIDVGIGRTNNIPLGVYGGVGFDIASLGKVANIANTIKNWAPSSWKLDIETRLGWLNGQLTTNGQLTDFNAKLVFLHENILWAELNGTINLNTPSFITHGNVTILDGVFKGNALVSINKDVIAVTAQGSIGLPNWDVIPSLIRKLNISGGVGLYLSPNDGVKTNDGIALWAKLIPIYLDVPVWGWKSKWWGGYPYIKSWERITIVPERLGVWLPFNDSGVKILGVTEIRNLGFSAAALPASTGLALAAAGDEDSDPSELIPQDYLISFNWGEANENAKGTLTLRDEDGNFFTITEEEMLSTYGFALVEDLCTDTQRTYFVRAPLAALRDFVFDIEGVDGETATLYSFNEPLDVQLNISSSGIGKLSGGGSVGNVENTAETTVTFYFDEDGDGFDGIPVYTTTLDKINEAWTPTGVAAGIYHVYVNVFDGQNVPVEKYLEGTVTVVPSTPKNLTIAQDGSNAVLTWDTVNDAATYEVYQWNGKTSKWDKLADVIDGTTYTIDNVSVDTQRYAVRAYEAGLYSDFAEITLETPKNLRSTQTGQTTLTLAWNKAVGATEYILQRFNGSSYETIYTGADSQYVDRGLTENTSYSYRVQAVGSAFSAEISARTASKIVGGKEVTDSPVVLSTVTSDGKTTVTWTNLGSDYRYLVYKDAQLVVNLGSATSYIDPNPAATGTYSVYAYNDTLKKWSWATPIVVTATAPKIEITGHEILPDGSIKLTWNGVGTNYMVYQSGFPASGSSYLKTTDWTDTKPLAENQYQIYASYVDPADGRTKWTWSNIYFVTKPAAAPAASPLDAFWAEYDNSIVDDDVLNGIV